MTPEDHVYYAELGAKLLHALDVCTRVQQGDTSVSESEAAAASQLVSTYAHLLTLAREHGVTKDEFPRFVEERNANLAVEEALEPTPDQVRFAAVRAVCERILAGEHVSDADREQALQLLRALRES